MRLLPWAPSSARWWRPQASSWRCSRRWITTGSTGSSEPCRASSSPSSRPVSDRRISTREPTCNARRRNWSASARCGRRPSGGCVSCPRDGGASQAIPRLRGRDHGWRSHGARYVTEPRASASAPLARSAALRARPRGRIRAGARISPGGDERLVSARAHLAMNIQSLHARAYPAGQRWVMRAPR